MERDTFPLEMTTNIIGAAPYNFCQTSLQVESPGARGIIFYFSGGSDCEIEIDGLGKLLIEVVIPITM